MSLKLILSTLLINRNGTFDKTPKYENGITKL
jgi:hypothetical protein